MRRNPRWRFVSRLAAHCAKVRRTVVVIARRRAWTPRARTVRALLAIGAALGLALAALGSSAALPDADRFPPTPSPSSTASRCNASTSRSPRFRGARRRPTIAARRRGPPARPRSADRRGCWSEGTSRSASSSGATDAMRSDIVASVVRSVVSGRPRASPADAEIAAFFAESRALFARPGRSGCGRSSSASPPA